MTAHLPLLIGLVLCAVQAALIPPLLRHARTARTTTGISIPGEAAWCIGASGWITYGTLTSSVPVAMSGVFGLTAAAGLLVILHPVITPGQRTVAARAMCAVLALFAGCMIWLGPVTGLALGLAIFGTVQFLPHMYAVLVLRGAPAAGVSATAAALRALFTGAWAVYAVLDPLLGTADHVDWPVLAWGVSGALVFSAQAVLAAASTAPDHRSGGDKEDSPGGAVR